MTTNEAKHTKYGHALDRFAECYKDLMAAEKLNAELEQQREAIVESAKEVIRISDRKHEAWDKLKALIASVEAKK